jgi:peptidoglycan/LPS O-acetylase OafA/YrhL
VAILGFILFAAAAYFAFKQVRSPAIQAAKGLAVAMIALVPWSPGWIRVLARFGTLSFGVYLVHLLCVVVIREVGRQYVSPSRILFYPVVVFTAFTFSYAIAITLNRTRWGKILFP